MSNREVATRHILDWKARAESGAVLAYNFLGFRVRVVTGDEKLAELLDAYFEIFIDNTAGLPDICVYVSPSLYPDITFDFQDLPPSPGKSKVKEEVFDFEGGRILRKKKTGVIFGFLGNEMAATGPVNLHVNQLVNFINNQFIDHLLRGGGLLFHAAAVQANGRGLALAGFSGAGKSTLALHIMNENVNFVSNDRLVVRRKEDKHLCYGVPKYPRINPGTILNNPSLVSVASQEDISRWESMDEDEIWDLEEKFDADIEECWGSNRFQLSSPLSSFIILNWKRVKAPLEIHKVNPEERRDLLTAVMKSPGALVFRPGDPDAGGLRPESEYLELLKGLPVYEVTGGVDFELLAKRLADFLLNGTMPDA